MFLAAVLDACPDLLDGVLATIAATGIPSACRVSIAEHRDHSLRGKRLLVVEPDVHVHDQHDHRHHASFSSIVHRFQAAPMSDGIRERALAIFELLAQAEGEVHGVPPADVTFHEVGAWDSIADIAGAACVLEALTPESWSIGPIPLGTGRVATAHGAMPVPAPVTARLLQGFALIDDGIAGERVTPTGAAILRYLWNELGAPSLSSGRPMKLERIGTGFGSRVLPGISNVLRVLLFDEAPVARTDDRVGVICFEIDDQTAEDLAVGIDALRMHEGVLDVLQVPAFGKKGRMVVQVQVLCRQDVLTGVIDACFTQTTTLGLRWSVTARTKLTRQMAVAESGNESLAVKIVERPDGRTTAKSDVEEVRNRGGHGERQQRRRNAEGNALRERASTETCRTK